MSRDRVLLLALLATSLCLCVSHEDHADEEEGEHETGGEDVNTEELEYHKGSLCGYCVYCKFCKLCDVDCPCEKGPTKPNCHMCKYCRYCYLCKVCDTVCQPGGIIDRVTSKIFNSLPKINRDEVDSDIDGVKTWIDKKKDEL